MRILCPAAMTCLLLACGCGGSGPQGLVADFTFTPPGPQTGQPVSFTDTSSGPQAIVSWSWTFAGGSPATSTAQNPTVTFSTAGDHAVTLTVTDSASDTDIRSRTVTVTDGLTLDDTPPSSPVRMVFVHHSCGNNWFNDGNGNCAQTLGTNNYYVRDTYYGWDAPNNSDIGSSTDIGHWYTWFADLTDQGGTPRRDHIMGALYTTGNQNAAYTPIADPGGENDIILFKSCYPNSNVNDDNATTPADLRGQACGVSAHTLSNCKQIYRDILAYFKTRTDKMFVVVTAPPLYSGSTDAGRAANARALNDWLVNDWLSPAEGDWGNKNVYVFDFFNVLTDPGNHHRYSSGSGQIEHINTNGDDFAHYVTGGDSHPTAEGNQKATDEFVPLLNVYYHLWQNM